MLEYNNLNVNDNFMIQKKYKYPVYRDRYRQAGSQDAYFWQDLWAARQVARNNPKMHYDIGSSISGFIGHLASFRDNIKLINIRPLDSSIPGVDFFQSDATQLLGLENESIESLSALCSLEHFGLGRYGDPVNPDACFQAMEAIQRVMMPGGHVYISVPIGKERVEFDAHRVFYARTIINQFDRMELIEYSCIYGPDHMIEENVPISKYDTDDRYGNLRYGLFHLIKKTN